MLTADPSGVSDADGLGAFSHQWLRDGVAIGGATASTYTLVAADVGTQISVEVSYTDGYGAAEGPLASALTLPVTSGIVVPPLPPPPAPDPLPDPDPIDDPTAQSDPPADEDPVADPELVPLVGLDAALEPDRDSSLGRRPEVRGIEVSPLVEQREREREDTRERKVERPKMSFADSSLLWEGMDSIRGQLTDEAGSERELQIAAAQGALLFISTALVGVLLRGGALFAAALSAMPIWSGVDPLVVLALSDEERRKREEALRLAREAEDRDSAGLGELLDDESES